MENPLPPTDGPTNPPEPPRLEGERKPQEGGSPSIAENRTAAEASARRGSNRIPARPRGKKNKRGKEPLWRFTAGDYGHAVTVFQKRGKRLLYISWWSAKKGNVERHSLGHADQELARKQAREMSDQIRLRTQPVMAGNGEPRLDMLLHLYYEEHGKHLDGQQPSEHARRRRLWTGFFANQERPIVYPRDLDQTLFEKFESMRRHGDLEVEGIALPEAAPEAPKGGKREAVVLDGTIDADFIYLNAALNWATNYRINGEALLKSKPKVPRCKPQAGTLNQPVATEDDLDALRPVLDAVDPQKLLRFWVELVNQYGWRVTGLSSVKANEIDFSPQVHAPYGRLIKNATIDKERRNDGVPLTKRIADVLHELLALRGLHVGDDAYLFPAPKGGGKKPWSRWHVGRLLVRAEAAAEIAHIGGLHAWRRKWHTERKTYPVQDVAKAAGYADPTSVERYRHADPETTYLVVTTPTVVVRRTVMTPTSDASARASSPVPKATGEMPGAADAPGQNSPVPQPAPRRVRKLHRPVRDEATPERPVADGIGGRLGSAARSKMPDGTIVESRDERFAINLAAARAYAAEHGHLMPKKHERPNGINLLMWLKNQEIRIKKGTMPGNRRMELEAIPEWRERAARRNVAVAGNDDL